MPSYTRATRVRAQAGLGSCGRVRPPSGLVYTNTQLSHRQVQEVSLASRTCFQRECNPLQPVQLWYEIVEEVIDDPEGQPGPREISCVLDEVEANEFALALGMAVGLRAIGGMDSAPDATAFANAAETPFLMQLVKHHP